MPRLNNNTEVFKFLDSLSSFRPVTPDAPDSTLAADVAKGAASITVATGDGTAYADGDPIIISGDGGVELNAVNGAPTGDTLTLKYKLAFPQSAGAEVFVAAEIKLGHVDENGVTIGGTQSQTPVNAATSRVPLVYQVGAADLTASTALRGYNNENLQFAFGATEDETGTGTANDPYQASIGTDNVGSMGVQCLRAMGSRFDGRTVMLDIENFQISVNASIQIGATTPATFKLDGKCSGYVQRIW